MNFDIRSAVARLSTRDLSDPGNRSRTSEQAMLQFNALLDAAKSRYPDSLDIRALAPLSGAMFSPPAYLRESLDLLVAGLDAAPDAGNKETPELSPKFGILRAESQLELDFEAHAQNQEALGLLFFDIDHFKSLNTEHTERIVDQAVLAPFQHHLLGLIRDRGYAYSVGGDEFIALLLNVDSDESLAFGNRLRREASQWVFPVEKVTKRLTLSIGVAHCPGDASSLNALRLLANRAENAAKKGGRDRVVRAEH